MRSMLEIIAPEAHTAIMSDADRWAPDITGARNGLAHNADGSGDRLLELAQATDATIAAYLMARLGLSAACHRRAGAATCAPY
jgi:hypothetical protein